MGKLHNVEFSSSFAVYWNEVLLLLRLHLRVYF
jgi:hypothetical protein